jgi:hypothetical protein
MVRFGMQLGLALVMASGLVFSASADVPTTLELNLGTSVTHTFQVSSSIAEKVKLSIDRADLDALAGGNKVLVTVTPAEVVLKPSQPVNVQFKVEVPTNSPSFSNVKLGVFSQGRGARLLLGETSLSVKPVIEVRLNGGSPETWSLPKNSSFVSHKDGLTVRFVSLDKTQSHTIHSSGAIPHQDSSLPPANDQGPTGVYEVVIKSGAGQLKAGVYCHDHEGFGNLRTMLFNVAE